MEPNYQILLLMHMFLIEPTKYKTPYGFLSLCLQYDYPLPATSQFVTFQISTVHLSFRKVNVGNINGQRKFPQQNYSW